MILRLGLPSTRTWASWRNGPAETSGNSSRTNTKCLLWCKDTGWSPPDWEQLCGKGPGGLGSHKLGTSQQRALAAGMADSSLERIHRGTARTPRKAFILLYLACLRPRLK